jgi:hypothetical protein
MGHRGYGADQDHQQVDLHHFPPRLSRPLTARRIDPLAISTPVVDER